MNAETNKDSVQLFRNWVKTQERSSCTYKYEENKITISTAYARAEVRFYEMNIVEFRILSLKNEETIFYLHFQLGNHAHTEELFREMMTSLLAYNEEQTTKILLCCSSALTTSYFAEQLNAAAKLLSLNYQFDAVSYESVYEKGLYYQMILLAPQIGFQQKKIHNAMKEIPIQTIPAGIFGKYDTGALISLVQKVLKAHQPPVSKAEKIAKVFDNSAKILCICVFNSSRHIRTIYRYYRNGEIETEGEIMKNTISISDIMDIIDTMLTMYPEIECVGLSMPGVAMRGRLQLPTEGIVNEDVSLEVYEKYHRACVLSNDCNQVAYGIYSLEDKYQDLIFHFQPYGYATAGAGIIANGELVRGKGRNAGELKVLQSSIQFSAPMEELAKTADGTYEIISKTIACEVSLLAPEAVYIHSAMAPDIDHLKALVKELVPETSMPEFHYVDDMREYMMVGTMLKTIEWYDRWQQGEWAKEFYKQ
jgi:cellobiose-specific phosphotransferase system component IIB